MRGGCLRRDWSGKLACPPLKMLVEEREVGVGLCRERDGGRRKGGGE